MKENKLRAEVEVKDIPEFTIAYIRHVGPYMGDVDLFRGLFSRLWKWAEPRGLMKSPDTKAVTMFHDNPDLVEQDKWRISVGISVPDNTDVDGDIGKMKVPAGRYAVARFEIYASQFGDAWDAVFSGWMPDSGYQPADGPRYEHYLNNSQNHPEGKNIVNICVAVKPL